MSDIVCVEQEFLRFFIEISSHQISVNITAKKMKFSIKDFSSKCDQISSFSSYVVTSRGEILNEKLRFLCSESNLKAVKNFRKKLHNSC